MISVDAPDDLTVVADPLRLRQGLGNLVDNALRHGDGTVTLTARRAGQGVELAVSDQGPGFPADLRERAFERFTRGDQAREERGAGLGLAIVQAIADARAGHTTTVAGAPTTVRISLPHI
jgi:signal transduction histidine kinase